MQSRRIVPRLRSALASLVALSCAACASLPRTPYTEAEAGQAVVPGFGPVRAFADAPDEAFLSDVRSRFGRSEISYLALSGGGGDGAYGAGVLAGWTSSGRRPAFNLVSGVSTGALIAPFAFLGSAYDPVIKEIYTSGIAETLLESPDPISAVFGTSLFSNDRLRDLVSRYVTPDFVAAVARERERGRALLVVTTNIDSQRPVVWDMGLIAREGSSRAVELFRNVLVASAAIPAIFPPVLIDVAAGDHAFQEMHVDGTVTAPVFTLPRNYLISGHDPTPPRRATLYVIMNSKLAPDFAVVTNRTSDIGARTFGTFVNDKARDDLTSLANISARRGYTFDLTYIGADFPDTAGVGFETEHMRRLYDYGFARGSRPGLFTNKVPNPGLRVPGARS